MKLLILSPTRGLYDSQKEGYNGVGWVASLQKYLEKESDIELALAFITSNKSPKELRGKTMYYPIHVPKRGSLSKLYYYWYGYKKDVFNDSIKEPIKEIINDFNPDIIHIFGTENNLAYIVGETNVPCIIHIQGILLPYAEIYFPANISERNFMKITSLREFWIRNGIVFNYKRMKLSSVREKSHIERCQYFMGRTIWDKEIVALYNSRAQYFHIDEVLRPPFYNAQKWTYSNEKRLNIVSTLSPTIYKGFDVVLKTAKVLKECGIEFEWNIIGINEGHKIIRIIEKAISLDSKDLNIKYLGIKEPEEIIEILHRSTMYVHPSYIDNSPNSLGEAQYIGVPTIATNVGGMPTMMDYRQEYMASPVAPHTLATRIIGLNKELQNGTYNNTLMKIAQERHNPKSIIKSLISTYNTLITKK